MSSKGLIINSRQLLAIFLNAMGIFLVVVGFVLLFPLAQAPNNSAYLLASNVYVSVTAMVIGIIFLVAAFIITLAQIRKPKQLSKK